MSDFGNDIPNWYTIYDKRQAGLYARYRVNMDKCKNPEFKAAYPGTEWVINPGLRNINCPAGLAGECNNVFGRCKITTKEECLRQSGDYKDNGAGEKPYLEWRDDLDNGAGQGQCIFGNMFLRNYCENPAGRRGGQVVHGVTDVPPFHYDVNTSSCQITKEYCKWMGVGFTASNKDGLPDCHEGWWQKQAEKFFGQTLVRGLKTGRFNKFAWDFIKMGLTTPGPLAWYEIYKGVKSGKYKEELGLNRKNTVAPEREDFTDPYSDKEYKEFLENLKKELETNLNAEMEKLKKSQPTGKNVPLIVKGFIDQDYISEKVLIKNDFGGKGIHLYLIRWSTDEKIKNDIGEFPIQLGFISSEIEKVYPELIRKIDGKKYIIILPELTKENNYIRRMYHIYSDPLEFFNFIGNLISIDANIKTFFTKTEK